MKTKQLLLLWAAAAAAVFSSCSDDSATNQLLERIPASADYVVVGDAKVIIESAGGTVEGAKVKLPGYIVDGLPTSVANSLDESLDFLKSSGVDVSAVAITGSFNDSHPTIVFHLADKKKFEDAIADNGFREKDTDGGVVYYQKKVYESSYDSDYDDYGYVAIADDYAYWVERVWVKSDFKPIKAIGRMVENAHESSYASTAFSKYIANGNAGGFAVRLPRELRRELRQTGFPSSMLDMLDGVICGNLSLVNDNADLTLSMFDEDGKSKSFKDYGVAMNLDAKISRKALSYIGNDESLVYAGCVKDFDWDTYFDMVSSVGGLSRSDKAALSLVQSYCEKIDGTIAIGFGLTNGLESIFNLDIGNEVFDQFAATIVIETKDGKANGMLNDLKDFLGAAEIPMNSTTDGFFFEIPDGDGAVYCEAKDNFIVVSNHIIKSNFGTTTVNAIDFSDYICAAALSVDSSNKLMRDLSLDNKVTVAITTDADKSEMCMHLNVSGKYPAGIIGNIAKMVIAVADQESSLEQKWREYRDRHYGLSSSYDDAVVEEAIPYEYADSCAVAE